MPGEYQRVKDIFLAAAEQSGPREREEYLRAACGGDAALRRRVEALLHRHEQAGGFLETPAFHAATLSSPDVVPTEVAGTRVGPYQLLEQIGEGGMGTVWMAEQQEPVRRKVALKIIKPGMDSRLVVARFEAERQALALMDHPNIARVFDGGTMGESEPRALASGGTPSLTVGALTAGPTSSWSWSRARRSRAPVTSGSSRSASACSCSFRSARPCNTRIRRGSSTVMSSRPTC